MRIVILGAESLGVRGLSCLVETRERKIIIDPGVCLGYRRHGLLPHPFQVAIGASVREKIIEVLKEVTDVVFSHFHGDHIPLSRPNPYQLGLDQVKNSLDGARLWTKGLGDLSKSIHNRAKLLFSTFSRNIQSAAGKKDGCLSFSHPVYHGEKARGTVMMTKIEEKDQVFVHASDIQLLDEKAIGKILQWNPDIVLASGPPLYLPFLSKKQKKTTKSNALNLSRGLDTLLIDHHLLRSEAGYRWLEELDSISNNKIMCSADFMEREPLFLEAWRKELYQELPVPEKWHRNYAQGKADFHSYRLGGWEVLRKKGKLNGCKWYNFCPIKRFTDQGKLERYWVENYCLISNKKCIRYQMEKEGEPHLDWMLPNGELRENLRQ